jgi:hypothetical protein
MKLPKNALRLTLGFLISIISGCASCTLKDQCEKTNWYNYGQDLAMRGQRIEQDNFIQECRKADAEISESKLDVGFKSGMATYCTEETAEKKGKEGATFNYDLCDTTLEKNLKASFNEGLQRFCTPKSGLDFGLAGGSYLKNCPEDSEDAFLDGYKRGRKKFLETEISNIQQDLMQIERDIDKKDYALKHLNLTSRLIPPPPILKPGVQSTDPNKQQRDQLNSQINNENQALRELQDRQRQLKNKLEEYKRELIKVS